jgi:PIN domain nuclease of toxin-antitoxin system
MKYLLDTSVFLWSLGAEHKLNKKAQDLLSSSEAELYLSAASSWEIAIKFALGTLALPKPPSLPPHHRDPFDRMLIAQARMENMVLLTADRTLLKYEVKTMFCGK